MNYICEIWLFDCIFFGFGETKSASIFNAYINIFKNLKLRIEHLLFLKKLYPQQSYLAVWKKIWRNYVTFSSYIPRTSSKFVVKYLNNESKI